MLIVRWIDRQVYWQLNCRNDTKADLNLSYYGLLHAIEVVVWCHPLVVGVIIYLPLI